MKNFILSITLIIAGVLCADAQTITEYNQSAISNQSLTYDQNWCPTGQFTLKNISNKTITNVEIEIYYKGYEQNDPFQPTTTCNTSTTIYPGGYGILRFRWDCGNKQPKSFVITRIRYSDGSICQVNIHSHDYYYY